MISTTITGSAGTQWRQFARCLGTDSAIFYPTTESEEGSRAAKAVCAGCPVQEECLEHALAVGEKQGVWGGLDERERRTLLRHRSQAGTAGQVGLLG